MTRFAIFLIVGFVFATILTHILGVVLTTLAVVVVAAAIAVGSDARRKRLGRGR